MDSQAIAGASSNQKMQISWDDEQEPMNDSEFAQFLEASSKGVNAAIIPFLQEQGVKSLTHGTSAAAQSAAGSAGSAAPFLQLATGLSTNTVATQSGRAIKPVTDPLIAAFVEKTTDSTQSAILKAAESFTNGKSSSQNSWSSI